MANNANTEHHIYKERGRLNRQIGLGLLVFVILVMIATMAKLSTGLQEVEAQNATTSEVSE